MLPTLTLPVNCSAKREEHAGGQHLAFTICRGPCINYEEYSRNARKLVSISLETLQNRMCVRSVLERCKWANKIHLGYFSFQ